MHLACYLQLEYREHLLSLRELNPQAVIVLFAFANSRYSQSIFMRWQNDVSASSFSYLTDRETCPDNKSGKDIPIVRRASA